MADLIEDFRCRLALPGMARAFGGSILVLRLMRHSPDFGWLWGNDRPFGAFRQQQTYTVGAVGGRTRPLRLRCAEPSRSEARAGTSGFGASLSSGPTAVNDRSRHSLKTLRLGHRRPSSVRERPEPQLLLADGPESRQTIRLDNQEKHDKRAEDHRLQIGHQIDRNLEPGEARRVIEKDRQ